MKNLLLVMLAINIMACGKGGAGTAASPIPGKPAQPGATPVPTHIYSMQIIASNSNNASYSVSMSVNWTDPDTQSIATGNVGPIVSPTVVTYNLTGRYLRQVQINKNNDTTPEGGITGKLYRDGVLQQTSITLTTGGTYELFNDLD